MVNRIFVVSAPSGAGKSSLVRQLCKLDYKLKLLISHTTRLMRIDELDSVDYFFISNEKFKNMIDSNSFIEYATVHNNFYGTSKKQIENYINSEYDVLLEIDYQGALNIKKLYKEKAVLIFIQPPSIVELKNRLLKRNTDDIVHINDRLQQAKVEFKYAKDFDHIVINDDFYCAVQAIYHIIKVYRT